MQEYTFGDDIHAPRDYIRLTAITYQSFGLDKKIDLQKQVYFLSVTNNLDAYILDEVLALKSHLKEIPDTNKSDNHKNKMK